MSIFISLLFMLKEGLENKTISQLEYNEMNPEDKEVGRFYCNFNVHKDYKKTFHH